MNIKKWASVDTLKLRFGAIKFLGILSLFVGVQGLVAAEYPNSTQTFIFPGGNLLTNGSFENNYSSQLYDGWLEGMTIDPAAMPILAPDPAVTSFEGNRHLTADYTCQATGEPSWKIMSDFFAVKPTTDYTLFFWYKTRTGTSITPDALVPGIRFWKAKDHRYDRATETFEWIPAPAGQSYEIANPTLGTPYSDNSGWTLYSLKFASPPGAVFGKVFLLHALEVGATGGFHFDNVLLVEGHIEKTDVGNLRHPESIGKTLRFINAKGKLVQTVTPDGQRDIIAQILYDKLGRVEKEILPIADDAGIYRHNFVPDITAAFDEADRLSNFYNRSPVNEPGDPKTRDMRLDDPLGGEAAQYPEADGRPYSEIAYENSPLARVKESAGPGDAWKIGSENTGKKEHFSTFTLPGDDGVIPPLTTSSGKYYVEESTGPNFSRSRVFTDRMGRVIRKSSRAVIEAENFWFDTDYSYDAMGNQTQMEAPKESNGVRLKTVRSFDLHGNLTEETNPESGKRDFTYDNLGRLRFTQSAEQRGEDIPLQAQSFSFIKYDEFGRIILTGEILDGSLKNQENADLLEFPCLGECPNPATAVLPEKIRVRTVNGYDKPEQSLSCSGGSLGSSGEIEFLAKTESGEVAACSYDFHSVYHDALTALQGQSGSVQILAIFNPMGIDEVKPPAGVEFPLQVGNLVFTFEAVSVLTAEGIAAQALFETCHQDHLAVLLGPGEYLKGRLVKSLSCNYELSQAFGDAIPREVSSTYRYDRFGNMIGKLQINRYLNEPRRHFQLFRNEYDFQNRLINRIACAGLDCTGPESHVEKYVYDRMGRLEKVLDKQDGILVHNHHNYLGQISAKGFGTEVVTGTTVPPSSSNSLLQQNEFHLHGWLLTTQAKQTRDNAMLFKESMLYEQASIPRYDGSIGSATYSSDSPVFPSNLTYSYEYDDIGRLRSATGSPASIGANEFYTYFDDGRIRTIERLGRGGIFRYDENGRLKEVEGDLVERRDMNLPAGGIVFEYDANGNITKDHSKDYSDQGQPLEIHYRADNLPYKFVYKAQEEDQGSFKLVQEYMVYDENNLRVSKIRKVENEWISTKSYFASGKEVREAEGSTTEFYDLAGAGRIQYPPASTSTQMEFYLKDHLGTTRGVYGFTEGELVFASHYFPYGKLLHPTQSTGDITHKFTGKELDVGADLTYFGARYYDQELGLWISPDPARQHHSPYTYGSNNPINRVDPDGLQDDEPESFTPNADIAYVMNFELNFRLNLVTNIVETAALGAVGEGALGIVGKLFFRTAAGKAIFYSGPGARTAALAYAAKTGGTAIDGTLGGVILNKLHLYKWLPSKAADWVWKKASNAFAKGASGEVNAFVKNANPTRVYKTVEEPILKASDKVSKIVEH